MKRFLYQASVKSAEGNQVFYIDAETREEADDRAAQDDTDGIHQNEVEVMDLYSLEFVQETTMDDYGDFPPAGGQAQDDRSDWCRFNGCSHKNAGSPVWETQQDADKVGLQTMTAKERFDAAFGDSETDPVERLRFFCSIAMSGQDWLDVEPFFDELTEEQPDWTDAITYNPVYGTLIIGQHPSKGIVYVPLTAQRDTAMSEDDLSDVDVLAIMSGYGDNHTDPGLVVFDEPTLIEAGRALLKRVQPASGQDARDAARYRWLRDENDWYAEPRLDEHDGTVWKLTMYTPARIEDPTDDDSLDAAIDAAMQQEGQS